MGVLQSRSAKAILALALCIGSELRYPTLGSRETFESIIEN